MKSPKKIASDIIEAITCKVSELGKAQMGLLDDNLEHCEHAITTIIKYNLDKNSERQYVDTELEDMEYRIEELQAEIQEIEKALHEKKAEQIGKMVR